MNNLDQHYIDFYKPKADYFYTELQKLDLPLDIIKETPALFIPCYGELYEQSLIKFAVMGKETLGWWNLGSAASNPLWGIKEFREMGPCDWENQFWHYFAQILGDIYNVSKEEILSPKRLVYSFYSLE
nr:hypothetical protein [uncultured bacterium]